jgi:hypothetical protein
MFCCISSHWKGQPSISIEAVISLIGSKTTATGLKIICVKDDGTYEIGIKVSDEYFANINIDNELICPAWNYTISPHI